MSSDNQSKSIEVVDLLSTSGVDLGDDHDDAIGIRPPQPHKKKHKKHGKEKKHKKEKRAEKKRESREHSKSARQSESLREPLRAPETDPPDVLPVSSSWSEGQSRRRAEGDPEVDIQREREIRRRIQERASGRQPFVQRELSPPAAGPPMRSGDRRGYHRGGFDRFGGGGGGQYGRGGRPFDRRYGGNERRSPGRYGGGHTENRKTWLPTISRRDRPKPDQAPAAPSGSKSAEKRRHSTSPPDDESSKLSNWPASAPRPGSKGERRPKYQPVNSSEDSSQSSEDEGAEGPPRKKSVVKQPQSRPVHEPHEEVTRSSPPKKPTHDEISDNSGESSPGGSRESDKSSPSHTPSDRAASTPEIEPTKAEEGVKSGKYSKFESSPEKSPSPQLPDEPMEPAVEDVVHRESEPEPETPVEQEAATPPAPALPVYYPAISGCRSVEEFACLNRIEEGTYGVVYRAKEKRTEEIVALKRLKMEKEKEGYPITSLREISTLLKAQHRNIVTVREIVVGTNMDKIYIVMDYVEHDMKSLMESMRQPFAIGEVKTLMHQLLSGVHHLHDNWILHRDLKTSNLLLSHRGCLKIGDFGLAREYGSPLKQYTPIVVTLWYRAPELLLGIKEYSTKVDMWSVGCIMAEFMSLKPLFPGRGELDQLNRIFKQLGTPSEKVWPGFDELPLIKKGVTFQEHQFNILRKGLGATLSDNGFDLLMSFLTYCPMKRVSALEGLGHRWFTEQPAPVPEELFPTWPAKSEQSKVVKKTKEGSPKPPSGGKQFYGQLGEAEETLMKELNIKRRDIPGAGFSLKFDSNLANR